MDMETSSDGNTTMCLLIIDFVSKSSRVQDWEVMNHLPGCLHDVANVYLRKLFSVGAEYDFYNQKRVTSTITSAILAMQLFQLATSDSQLQSSIG